MAPARVDRLHDELVQSAHLSMRLLPILLILCLCAGPAASAEITDELRGVWVVRTSLVSEASIRQVVADAKAGGFTAVFVQVRGRGDAYYTSRHEPRAQALAGASKTFDPLATVIAEAQRAGLAVHAWVNVSLIADATDLPASRDHLVRRHPDWLMVPRELASSLARIRPRDQRYVSRLATWTRSQTATVEGLFASPFHEGARDHLMAVVDDLVSRYPIDGLHLDYIRLPGSQFDFSRKTLDAFARHLEPSISTRMRKDLRRQVRANPFIYVDRFPDTWLTFRRDAVTALLRAVRHRALQRRPHLVVTAAVVPDLETGRRSRAQAWDDWLAQGLLDAVCPMAYTTDDGIFAAQAAAARRVAGDRGVLMGVGTYRLDEAQTLKRIQVARDAGADGFVLFSYDSFLSPDRGRDMLIAIGRAATR